MTDTMPSPFSFADAFERRLSRALRAAAPGDPPFPAARPVENATVRLYPPVRPSTSSISPQK